jgi:hypothetical protein
VIETDPLLHVLGNKDGALRRGGWSVADGEDKDLADLFIRLGGYSEHESGPILLALLPPARILVGPEIGVSDNRPRLWRRKS